MIGKSEAGDEVSRKAAARAAGRAIEAPTVHVATHGFFANDRCGPADNPLLLSGLAFAGANRRYERRGPGDRSEDGILTAEEVASLDLSGVEWVVLSACETGTGEVLSGEGVLGLRRAFEVAGAGTLILSLWPVEDTYARQWMQALYERRLDGGATAAVVRQASLQVIESRREAGRSTHPFYWGAFVATGDWR